MSDIIRLLAQVETATNTGRCPLCGALLAFDFHMDTGWEYTCPACHWACGGNVP